MNEEKDIKEEVIGFEALYKSMYKCTKNVLWKDSVASFYLNGIEETLRLEKQLKEGTYKARAPKKFTITHPKRREIVSIAFRDRVYQRSLNDNVIYPTMTRSFVHENMACQKGKGTSAAEDKLDEYLRRFYRKNGLQGYILQCDIKGYYPNMKHEIAEETFRKRLHPDIYDMAEKILRDQYEGAKGYNPGSQMIQIAGISALDSMDHMIKEKLHAKMYIRYMDDFLIIHEDRKRLEEHKRAIEEYLRTKGFKLNEKKTKIYPIADGIKFLGFTHRLTGTGKVLRLIDPKNVKQERKKLRRMVALAKNGKLRKEKVDECFGAWKAHAEKGNSYKLINRMNQYYLGLWKENKDADSKKDRICERAER